jgi:N-methylhydantoinase B
MARELDPITYEVIRHGLLAGAAEMKVRVMRSSYATLWREAGDLSCAIMTPRAELIAQGPADIPVHLATLPFCLEGMLRKIDPATYEEGDVLFQNDPLWGNNHLPDCVTAKPIFVNGEIVAYAVVRGHWTDIGGIGPGSYTSVTTDHLQEGLTIPPVKIYKRGRLDEELADLILSNVRNRRERLGDLRAQYAGCIAGERTVLGLVKKYGQETVRAAFSRVLDHAETLTRQEIEKIPDGTYHFTAWSDGDGVDDRPIKIQVALSVKGSDITVDFTGSAEQARGGMNAPIAVTTSATLYAIKCATDPWNPANSGSYRPVKVIAPPGSIANPHLPCPVILGNHETAGMMAAAIFGALDQANPDAPQRTIAGGSDSATLFTLGGRDPRPGRAGRSFICVDLQGMCWGARHDKDGINGFRSGVGNSANNPTEVLEVEYPLLVEFNAFVPDAGGPGRFRGGLPMRKAFRFLADSVLTMVAERTRFPAHGLRGGGAGAPAQFVMNPGTPGETRLFSKTPPIPIKAGTVLWLQPGGGGGFGDPLERDPERVREDVRNEYVSLEGAARDYGVALRPATLEVDLEATRRLRAERRAGASPPSPSPCGEPTSPAA